MLQEKQDSRKCTLVGVCVTCLPDSSCQELYPQHNYYLFLFFGQKKPLKGASLLRFGEKRKREKKQEKKKGERERERERETFCCYYFSHDLSVALFFHLFLFFSFFFYFIFFNILANLSNKVPAIMSQN